MSKQQSLTELSDNSLDWIRQPEIAEGVTPVGRPRTIKMVFEIARITDFSKTYSNLIRDNAPEGADSYVIGLGKEYSAIQYYKQKASD